MNYISQKLPPGLYLVGVPIGTARDITLRALDILASADLLAAEDTRSLRKLMDIHGIPLDGRRIVALHDHSKNAAVQRLADNVAQGQSLAYASEAGMPLIADPGFELVKAVQAGGHLVTSAPGPSAVPTALALAGLPTDAFHFAGFLPAKQAARRKAFLDLAGVPATLVFFEAPGRIAATVSDAAQVLGGTRNAVICRELTKKFEEVLRGTLAELAVQTEDQRPKGEIVLLIDRGATEEVSDLVIDGMLKDALETMSVKDSAAFVAEATGVKRRILYQKALSLAHKQ